MTSISPENELSTVETLSKQVNKCDFDLIQLLGKGGFGSVYKVGIDYKNRKQVQKKDEGSIYTMKIIEKSNQP